MKYKGSSRKIKSVFIHRPLQREFTMLMVIILMVATLFIGVVIHLTIQETLTSDAGGLGRSAAYDFLAEIDQKLLIRVFAVLFVTVVAAIMGGVFFLHRVAGPIYRIRLTIKRLAEDQIPERSVRLRHGDFFQEVADELNRLIDKMRQEHPERVVRAKETEVRPPESSE
jgi:sensor histidine kinase YesM